MPIAYTVYVIELSRKVFTEHRKFREANPQYNGVLECLYVGQTGKTPQECQGNFPVGCGRRRYR